jgi:ankyrin repeat protein
MRKKDEKLLYACYEGSLDAVHKLLKKGTFRFPAKVNIKDEKGKTPLLLSIDKGYIEIQ